MFTQPRYARGAVRTLVMLIASAVTGFVSLHAMHAPHTTPFAPTLARTLSPAHRVQAVVGLPAAAPAAADPAPPPAPERVRPAAGGITGVFGEWRGNHVHAGVDFAGSVGDPIVAAANGTVAVAGYNMPGLGGYGNIVVVDHGDGTETRYAHLSRIDVAVGQAVTTGQPIGALGSTGHSTGPHLHFEVRINGTPIDPMTWLPAS